MHKEYLIFNLYGPLASFGDTAVGEYRPSYAYPSKSSILGLVAAALGLRREDPQIEYLNNSFGFGVLVLTTGKLLRDFHTIQVPTAATIRKRPAFARKEELDRSGLSTILSSRDYRQDAFYRVALWHKNGPINLKTILASLKEPQLTLYLGRKACTLGLPLAPEIVTANNLKDAFKKTKHNYKEFIGHIHTSAKSSKLSLHADTDEKVNDGQIVMRKDNLANRKNWQYVTRNEFVTMVEAADVL